jgi:hypothetical protein
VRRQTSLGWIDAREAVIGRVPDDHEPIVNRLESDVPAHHRSTGHVRHNPGIRHGGGGVAQTAEEPRRLEHLERFVASVAERLPDAEDVLILGPGTVRERLERTVRARDERARRERSIRSVRSTRLTERQLIARLRTATGREPERRNVGAPRAPDARSG